MTRRGFLLLVALLAGVGLAAPGPTVITFWHAMRGHRGVALQTLVDGFNRENPDVVVQARFIGSDKPYGNDYHALYQAILKHLAEHQPPDVAQVYENWTVQLMSVQAVAPVQPFLTADDHVADLVPAFREANTWNGTLVTMPFNKSVYLLYYNPRLVPRPPRSVDDLRRTCEALARRGVYGVTFQPGMDFFGDLLYANGGAFFDGSNRAAFSGAAGVQALRTLQQLNREHAALPAWDAQDQFLAGKAAMYVASSTAQVELASRATFGFKAATLPSGAARSYQFAGTNLAILAPPERQAAAARLIRYLAHADHNARFATQTGYLPVHRSALADPTYEAFVQEHPGFQVGLDALPYAHIQPRVSAWENVRLILDDAVFSALSGTDPATALQQAAQQSDDLIRKLGGG
ncbi:MAG TPA: ABC transporter substrate-binding protein [Candidatus Xenobia bacterium]